MALKPPIHFETYGQGPALMLGYPLMASKIPDSPAPRALEGYLGRLTDHYRVLVMDYPNMGRSEPIPAGELTAGRVCDDLLRVADAATFDRFAWWGYSWGGIVGLLLAGRTDRLTGLVCGGWSPLGGLHRDVLESCRATRRTLAQQEQYVTFYESIQDWQEAQAVRGLSCPRMAYAGSEDVIERGGARMETAAKLRAHRRDLEMLGWEVEEIPGADHSVWTDPGSVVPRVRPFLDKATGRGT